MQKPKEKSTATYKMTVDLNVLDHLGINLYSNLAAVLTEIVANAWDADADRIDIKIDEKDPCQFIEIHDNGRGMTIEEMNNKYLKVGYRRRQDESNAYGSVTPKGRKVMGRKGLGKLALFSIAKKISIQSVGEDKNHHGLTMTIEEIQNSINRNQSEYIPTPLPAEDISVEKGTLIRLEQINRSRIAQSIFGLKKRLARRFSIFGDDFIITINGETITLQDRDDLAQTQFLWKLEDTNLDTSAFTQIKQVNTLSNRLDIWTDSTWKVSGWIGTAKTPKQLDSKDIGNLNTIVVLSRGRLFHENILDKINDGRIYTKYLTGQIEVDFLDIDNLPDIATSDRQRIQENDPRYQELLAFMRHSLNKVESKWSELRRKHETEEAKSNSPALIEWIDSLPEVYRKSADALIANLSTLHVENLEDKKTLYKHGILAFERMRLRNRDTENLTNSIYSLEKLIGLIADRDMFEASLYGDIVRSRLDTIINFNDLVDQNQKEKVLQQYLFEHLWLLDPSWERIEHTKIMEKRLIKSGIKTDDMTEIERLGRVDIAYRTTAGKHLIIELKKADRNDLTIYDLARQGSTYVDKLKKILLQTDGDKNPNIEVIFVIGRPVPEEISDPERVKNTLLGVSPGSRIVHYDALISNAQKSYQEYLEQNKSINKLDSILERI